MAKLKDEEICTILHTEADNPNYVPWYKSRLVAKSNSERAAKQIIALCKNRTLPYIQIDELCKYNKGRRKKLRNDFKSILTTADAVDKEIKRTSRHEERMCRCLFVQQYAGDFEVVDFQIPTSDKGHDKIDLLLKDKDGTFYITETKKFSPIEKTPSPETFLRCVLEIQTYRQKINKNFLKTYDIDGENKLSAAVLLDKDTYAWSQLNSEWAKELIKLFNITLLELTRDGKDFVIKKI